MAKVVGAEAMIESQEWLTQHQAECAGMRAGALVSVLAHAAAAHNNDASRKWLDSAVIHLKILANTFGYDLVKKP